MRRPIRISLAVVAATTVVAAGLVTTSPTAYAQAGCAATYRVVGQWQGGFQGAITVTNLGSPLNGWQLTFAFPTAGQTVSQGWGGRFSQSGANVTAANESFNATLGTNASAELGFIASWSGSNPSPTSFSLNGIRCTGQAGPTTPPPSSPPPSSPPPSSPPPSSPPPSQTDPWNPPSNLATGLNEVWAHYEQTYPQLYTFNNYGWDQVLANGGSINYCVRWDSSAPVTATLRDQIHAALARSFAKWMDTMVGWNEWPYQQVPVRVVGWAVRDRSTLQWTDNSVDIYVNDIRENAPQCATACGRFFNRNGNYPNCPGGNARHYDMSLWLTAGFGGGHGGDWGQRMGSEYFVNNRNNENITILLHEIGHSFGLDDFYDWTPTGVCCFIMKAGSSGSITEFDRWMLRDWWRHLKSRYGF